MLAKSVPEHFSSIGNVLTELQQTTAQEPCFNISGCHVEKVDNEWRKHKHRGHLPTGLPCGKKHDDVIKWKPFPCYWPFVRGIHRSPVNSPHKGQWRGALMFSLICVWINGWVNNREAGDLRRYRARYDVIVMGHDYFQIRNVVGGCYICYRSLICRHMSISHRNTKTRDQTLIYKYFTHNRINQSQNRSWGPHNRVLVGLRQSPMVQLLGNLIARLADHGGSLAYACCRTTRYSYKAHSIDWHGFFFNIS